MNFGDLVGSIGQAKAPPPPVKPASKPANVSLPASSKLLAQRPAQALPVAVPPGSLKRKITDRDGKNEAITKITNANDVSHVANSRPSTPSSLARSNPGALKNESSCPTTLSQAPAKTPSKGSYADILARAKQAQELKKAQAPAGTIRHQATIKEKLSKVAQRKKEEEERKNATKPKGPQKMLASSKTGQKPSSSPTKKDALPKERKAPRPPLHAPASSYKGTIGSTINRSDRSIGGGAAKRRRYDEYLGTDEEDDSQLEDEGDDDGYGYGSDESSDMEAGMNDIEDEERLALKHAKADDARELALENRLKQEKEERRRKLAAMAAKGRR